MANAQPPRADLSADAFAVSTDRHSTGSPVGSNDSTGLGRTAKLLAFLVGCALVTFLAFLSAQPADGGALDPAWQISLPELLAHGQIAGRDFIFTNGFIYQLVAQVAVQLHWNHSVYDTVGITNLLLSTLGIWIFGLALLLIRRVRWQHLTLLLGLYTLMGMAITETAYRPAFLFLVPVLLARLLSLPAARARQLGIGLLGGLCAFSLLFNFDIGLYAPVLVVTALLAFAVLAQMPSQFPLNSGLKGGLRPGLRSRDYLLPAAIFAVVFALGNVLIGLAFKLTSPAYGQLFEFQLRSLEMVSGYNRTVAVNWALGPFRTSVIGLAIAYGLGYFLRNRRALGFEDRHLLLGLLLISLIYLKTAMTRSDTHHIVQSTSVAVLTFALLGVGWTVRWTSGPSAQRYVWVLILLLLLMTWPGMTQTPFEAFVRTMDGEDSVETKTADLFGQTTPPSDEQIAVDLMAETPAGSSTPGLLAFPYQNDIPILAGRRLVVGSMLQAYMAHTEALEESYIAALERQRGRFEILYTMDRVRSIQVDEVQAVTRTPRIFEYIYTHYQADTSQPFNEAYAVLTPRPEPISLTGEAFDYSLETVDASSLRVRTAESVPCSLLELHLTIRYPAYAFLGRMTPFVISVLRDGQLIFDQTLVPYQVGESFRTYLSLMPEDEFYRIFADEPVAGVAWNLLEIYPQPTTLFGVPPSSLALDGLECIQVGEQP